MRVLAGLSFAPEHGLKLDAYLPATRPKAVVLYLHGGGFLKGSRDEPFSQQLAQRLVPMGLCLASASYRLRQGLNNFLPEEARAIAAMQARSKAAGLTLAGRLCGPAMIAAMRDAGAAVAALRAGLVPEVAGLPIVILGVSAGGIAGLSLSYPPQDEDLSQPDAVLCLAGAMVQPWRLLPGGPPCVMLHGKTDRVIGPENARLVADKATARGVALTLVESRIAGHTTQVAAFMDGRDAQGRPYFTLLTDLLDDCLAGLDAAKKPVTD